MKKYFGFIFGFITLVCTAVLLGCSSDDENSSKQEVSYFKGTRVDLMGKDALPQWVRSELDKRDAMYAANGQSYVCLVYCLKYNGKEFYRISDEGSCPFCDVKDKDGVDWSEVLTQDELSKLSTTIPGDWEIVYSQPSLIEMRD